MNQPEVVKKKKKENVFIDVYLTEDSQEIYFLGQYEGETAGGRTMSDTCSSSGFFYDKDELDKHLEEHADEIEIVQDYRTE